MNLGTLIDSFSGAPWHVVFAAICILALLVAALKVETHK